MNSFSDHILCQLFQIILNISQNINEEITDNPLMKIFSSKRANRILSKIKKGHSLELITPVTIKILQSNKSKTIKDKKGDNTPNLELTEVLLVYHKIVDNHYQQYIRVFYRFIPNTWFGQLPDISPKKFIFLKTFPSQFSNIEVWFTDQNSKPLQIGIKIKITLFIN